LLVIPEGDLLFNYSLHPSINVISTEGGEAAAVERSLYFAFTFPNLETATQPQNQPVTK
jgi:hypothetical protein